VKLFESTIATKLEDEELREDEELLPATLLLLVVAAALLLLALLLVVTAAALLLLGATLEELDEADKLDDTTELQLEELSASLDEDGLSPASALLDDNASSPELETPAELLLGSSLLELLRAVPEEFSASLDEDGLSPASALYDKPSAEEFPM
jgi:hypothetical protein